MGKIFSIVLILVAIWVGLTVYTEGTDRAFGGLLVRVGLAEAHEDPHASSPARRVGERVDSRYRQHEERTERLLGQ